MNIDTIMILTLEPPGVVHGICKTAHNYCFDMATKCIMSLSSQSNV